jgi:hypothetical protein
LIQYNATVDLTVAASQSPLVISNNIDTITFNGTTDEDGLVFNFTRTDGNQYFVSFDLRYYNSDQGGDDYRYSGSGAYIFKPAKN